MTKQVYIIHGWSGSPKNFWLDWLGKELDKRGIKAVLPKMPDTDMPIIKSWVEHLASIVGRPGEDVYFVGHSIGCQTIFRYLETINSKVGGVICVAGWFNLPNLETEEEKNIAKKWLETPIDFEKIKSKVKNQIVAIFSDDDPDVPLSDSEEFKNKLGSKIIVEHGRGHFSDDSNTKELPVVLDELLKMIKVSE